MDQTERTRALLLCDIVIDSLSPTNTLIGNPAALKRLFETGGASLLRGFRNAYDDFIAGNTLPAQVDSRNFEVGNNLVNTEGTVVFRNDMLEVIQYTPLSEKAHEIPLLLVPPQINKFYVLDLTPDKSLIRYLVSQGFRVFCISWFNPGPAQGNWGHPYSTIICLLGWTLITLFQAFVERETAVYALAMVAVSWPVYRYLTRS